MPERWWEAGLRTERGTERLRWRRRCHRLLFSPARLRTNADARSDPRVRSVAPGRHHASCSGKWELSGIMQQCCAAAAVLPVGRKQTNTRTSVVAGRGAGLCGVLLCGLLLVVLLHRIRACDRPGSEGSDCHRAKSKVFVTQARLACDGKGTHRARCMAPP